MLKRLLVLHKPCIISSVCDQMCVDMILGVGHVFSLVVAPSVVARGVGIVLMKEASEASHGCVYV